MSITEDGTRIPQATISDPLSTPSSRSASPAISIAPPTPGEEFDLPSAISGIAIQQPTPDARKHTNMGWAGQDLTYIALSEEKAASELQRLANPKLHNGSVHTVSIQPHPEKHSQDRYVTTEWDVKDSGVWKFRAVFDGHAAGDETVDYTYSTLPSKIQTSLNAIPTTQLSDVDVMSAMLRDTISAFDESITQGILELFPSPEFIEKLSDDEIRTIVNDRSASDVSEDDTGVLVPSPTGPVTIATKYAGRGSNNIKITRGMRGTTVLVVLISPSGGVWTASLGDCQAIIGQKTLSGNWSTNILSVNHNASEPSEIARLKKDHPGEENDVVTKNRVLSLIAVTRAIGDHQFKLPGIYTLRVFALTLPGMNRAAYHAQAIMERNKTPPYVSGTPEVGYFKLEKGVESFLIMCSDGLMDLYGGENWQEHDIDMIDMFKVWVDLVGKSLANSSSSSSSTSPSTSAPNPVKKDTNLALTLLRRGFRGPTLSPANSGLSRKPGSNEEALDRMSSLLTLEYKDKWMDDTTVLVEIL